MAEEAQPTEVSFKIKTSGDGAHEITMLDNATVLQLKEKLSGDDYEKIAVDRMRLIYSGRVMKDAEPLSTYKIKAGNTVHMVKSAASNAAQKPANPTSSGSTTSAAAGVPTNMAAGTANNPLAGLTGARYAGHVNLPGMDMFGADGGMGAPPNEDQIAHMLDDPNTQQIMNEALQNPAMIDMMIQSVPGLRDNPHAREMLQSPEFRAMMTNPDALRQASAMRRMMGGGGGAGGASAFPAPGATDSTPAGAASSNASGQSRPAVNPLLNMNPLAVMARAGGNPFAALFAQGAAGVTPSQTPPAPGSAGQAGTPSAGDQPNPFASIFGQPPSGTAPAPGAGQNAFGIPGMPPMTPEMMREAMQMFNNNPNMFGANAFGAAGTASSPPPADTRPPEEQYADQLRQLNDMGFFDFDQNVQALRRAGGSVQGAIEQLLR